MLKKLFENKNAMLAVLGAVCGIVFLFMGIVGSEENVQSSFPSSYDSEELQGYTDAMEKKLEDFLEHIGGISNVEVLLTVESSCQTVYATEGSNSDYVIVKDSNGNENAIPLTEITATIRGIAIVCDYGGNEELRKTVIGTLASLFDIGSNRISVVSA